MISCNLPSLIERKNFPNYNTFFSAICNEFMTHIVGLTYNGRTISLQNPQNHTTVRHIVSKDTPNGRIPDRSRAEKITWIKYILSSSSGCPHCSDYLIWKKRHKGSRIRWYIYCAKEKYIVILEEHGSLDFYLITAFNVTPQNNNQYIKEYNQFVNYGIR